MFPTPKGILKKIQTLNVLNHFRKRKYSLVFKRTLWAGKINYPDSEDHGAIKGPIWGRQDPGGPHDAPMNFVIWVSVEAEKWQSVPYWLLAVGNAIDVNNLTSELFYQDYFGPD